MRKVFDEDAFRSEIDRCTTKRQVYTVLRKYGRKVVNDDSAEMAETTGRKREFSIWISKTERIYKPLHSKTMKYQKWHYTEMVYSGIPTFFATNSYF